MLLFFVSGGVMRGRQSPRQDDDRARFGVSVEYVSLSVVVRDRRGRLVTGLTEDDFRVYENGYMQDIDFFQPGSTRLMVVVMIDASASMRSRLRAGNEKTRLDMAKEASVEFLRTLSLEDKKTIVFFNNKLRASLTENSFADLDELERKIAGVTGEQGTALYQSLYVVLHEFAQINTPQDGHVWQKAVIVLSDGIDTSSMLDKDAVIRQISEKQIMVYSISTQSRSNWRESYRREHHEFDVFMDDIAREGGGDAYFPENVTELKGEYGRIAEELRSRYVLAYQPDTPGKPGTWRYLTVKTTCDECTVRTRRGYIAAR